jgi:hypothetical protein
MKEASRYQGKPLLRLLECFVLKAINELDPSDAAKLSKMEPKLTQVYNVQGTWDQIIATVMNLPVDAPSHINELWIKNQGVAKNKRIDLLPQQFAEMFVDDNFVS